MRALKALSLAVLMSGGAVQASTADVSVPSGVEMQTFTAGFSQTLDALDLHNDHWVGSAFQPLTMGIEKANAEDAPGGASLGSRTVQADLVSTTYGTPTVVPEPADAALFLLGLALMVAKVRSRRH